MFRNARDGTTCMTRERMFFALLGQQIPVANRMPLFKIGMRHVRQVFDAVTADAVVHKPAMFVVAKFISDDAAAIESVQPFMADMISPFVSAHPKETLVEMVVANKSKTGF